MDKITKQELIAFENEIKKLFLNCDLVACCCGHGRYPMTIIGKYRSDGHIRELLSGTDIPRKRNFYRSDKDGFYYIPELNGGN